MNAKDTLRCQIYFKVSTDILLIVSFVEDFFYQYLGRRREHYRNDYHYQQKMEILIAVVVGVYPEGLTVCIEYPKSVNGAFTKNFLAITTSLLALAGRQVAPSQ
jgi:hypothetical protein